jgi:hypothetical protein
VRLNAGRGRRSQARWVVFVCTCLAMALSMAFDLLDLDGLEPRALAPGNVIATPAEMERAVPQVVSIPEILGFFSHTPVLRSVSEVSLACPCLRVATCGARISRLRPCVYKRRDAAATIPLPDDPT